MNRPKFLHVGGTLYWTIRTRNPDTQVLKDADSTPTVAIRKNGASTGDSVTVTKRSATTGIYDCSYNPAGEVEGDEFTVEESATVTGTTTGSATYSASWEFTVLAVERGTDSSLTSLGTNAPAGWLNAAAFASGSLSGKGDWSTVDALSTVSSTLQNMILALNNLSAKANWFGSLLLEVPDSGTRAYQFELVVRDDEDKLVNLDANPTIALTNTAGTDRSSLITTPIANPSTGRYTLTISVGTSTTNEALKLTATGTISGETRYAVIAPQVVDYDTATLINSIYTRIGAPTGASIAADIAASKTVIDSIKTDTGTTIPGLFTTLTTKIRKFFQLIARKDTAIATDNATELSELNANGGSGAGAYSQASDSLEAIRDRGDTAWVTGSGGGGGGSGTGARTVTITVNDGTTALQNATVRLTEGANTFTASTNASGVATFNVDDATYTVAITKAGYSYSGTTLAVSASTSVTYSMTAITITPSTGDQTTGFLTTLDETGQAEANVSIYVSVADVPNDYGLALDEATRTITSDEDGLVEITGMVKGATYNLRRGLKGRLYAVTIPTSAGSTYELPNMAGV